MKNYEYTCCRRPVKNYNLVTEHFLSVIHECLDQRRRLSPGGSGVERSRQAQIDVVKENVIWLLSTDEER